MIDKYEKVIKKIHSYGISVHGFFILGLDEDDKDVFKRTVSFAQEMRLESAQFAWPIPYPGTALGEYLDKAGRIVTKDWSQYESNVVFEPMLMSSEILQMGLKWAWLEFYSLLSIWRRLGIIRRYPVQFWMLNLYYRFFWQRKFKTNKDRKKCEHHFIPG